MSTQFILGRENSRPSRQVIILIMIVMITSCATVRKPQIIDIKTEPLKPIVQSQKKVQKTIKRRVAIARFTNESSYGGGRFSTNIKKEMNKQAVDILSKKLLETEKFILLERADADKLNEEIANSNDLLKSNRVSADYLLVGSITEFGRKDQGEVGFFSRTKRQIAYAKVFIRLIDVETGEILFSEEGVGESTTESGSVFGVGERAGYDSTINDQAIDTAISSLTNNIIDKLTEKEWKGFVIGVDNGEVLLTGGPSQNINKGDIFDVFLKGNEVFNPQSGKKISLPGKQIGSIKVLRHVGQNYSNEISICEVLEGELEIFRKERKAMYVVYHGR